MEEVNYQEIAEDLRENVPGHWECRYPGNIEMDIGKVTVSIFQDYAYAKQIWSWGLHHQGIHLLKSTRDEHLHDTAVEAAQEAVQFVEDLFRERKDNQIPQPPKSIIAALERETNLKWTQQREKDPVYEAAVDEFDGIRYMFIASINQFSDKGQGVIWECTCRLDNGTLVSNRGHNPTAAYKNMFGSLISTFELLGTHLKPEDDDV